MSKYHRIKGKRCYDNANHYCNFTYWELWLDGYFYAKRNCFKIFRVFQSVLVHGSLVPPTHYCV